MWHTPAWSLLRVPTSTRRKNKKTSTTKRRLHMPRGKRTSISTAAQAKALADIGYQGSQIAEATGLPTRTVDDIINGRMGWGRIIANDQAFKQYRTDAKRKMQAISIQLSQKALQ